MHIQLLSVHSLFLHLCRQSRFTFTDVGFFFSCHPGCAINPCLSSLKLLPSPAPSYWWMVMPNCSVGVKLGLPEQNHKMSYVLPICMRFLFPFWLPTVWTIEFVVVPHHYSELRYWRRCELLPSSYSAVSMSHWCLRHYIEFYRTLVNIRAYLIP